MTARPTLVFSHANGFPGACYRKLYSFLEDDFRVLHVDCFGHDPRYPVTDGWVSLRDQLADFAAAHARDDAPVIAVGHSLGGYLSLLAAASRPSLFSAIVLLDSPIPGAWKGAALGMLKRFGLVDRVTPAGVTRERRREWASVEAVYHHFQGKPAFRQFDPNCLRDYATLGTVPAGGGVRLVFDPQVEYRIYQGIPHDLARHLPGLTVPAGFIGGRRSADIRRIGLDLTQRHFRVDMVEGGHLFPFEHPRDAAKAIREMIAMLGVKPGGNVIAG